MMNSRKLIEFIDQFITFLKNQNFQRLIILGASYKRTFGDKTIQTSNYIYLPNERFKIENKLESSSMNYVEWNQTDNWINESSQAVQIFRGINQTVPCCILYKLLTTDNYQREAADMVRKLRALINGL